MGGIAYLGSKIRMMEHPAPPSDVRDGGVGIPMQDRCSYQRHEVLASVTDDRDDLHQYSAREIHVALCHGHIFEYIVRSRKSLVRQFSRNGVGRGYLVAVTGSSWQLRGLYVALAAIIRGAYWKVAMSTP